jgi:hypothetical protein
VSGSRTEVKFITKCCPKKNTRNKPESAMATLRAMEEEIIPIWLCFQIFELQKYGSKKGLPKIYILYNQSRQYKKSRLI